MDNCQDGADRKAHEDLPFLEWFIKQVGSYKSVHGVQLVDYIDVHFYPQEANVVSDDEDTLTATLRLRAPRSLWDPTYVDESWIAQPINIIGKMKNWTSMYMPDMGLAISEYNFGGDTIITGALAHTETLGIFAREGVDVASRWVCPQSGSLAEETYKLFLNVSFFFSIFLFFSLSFSMMAKVSPPFFLYFSQ